MSYQEIFYPESAFGGFTDIDGTMVFFSRVNSLLKPRFTVLDVGCGRGEFAEDPVEIRRHLRILKGKVQKVIGIDVDSLVCHNPFIDEFYPVKHNDWPISSDSIDLILCDFVLEHMEDAEKFFAECGRVLRDEGYLCIRTPNLWSYFGFFSRLIPDKYHSSIVKVAQDVRKQEDVFPKLYRCNTLRLIRKMMAKHQFESVVYGYEAEPAYLSFSKIAYWLGVLHQRFAPSSLKPVIFAFGRMHKDQR